MSERSDLEKKVDVLRTRLYDLERKPANEIDRPIREVGISAIRDSLAQVGRRLSKYPPKTL